MTSDEIKATIERLEALVRDRDNMPLVHEVADAFVGADGYGLRNMLVDLLRQADPYTHMKLPVDVDGVPIHIGDEMDFSEGVRSLTVLGIGTSDDNDSDMGVYVFDDDGYTWFNARFLHHHKPTIEDVLREFGDEVKRCCDTEDTIAEYAAKLREVMQDE